MPLAAATVAFFAHPVAQRLTFGVLLFDAAGLGLFTVTGTLKALDHGLGAVQSAVLGVTTGVGGGLLRDIIARQTPALVRVDSDLYSIPAMLGAAAVTSADRMNLPMAVAGPVARVRVRVPAGGHGAALDCAAGADATQLRRSGRRRRTHARKPTRRFVIGYITPDSVRRTAAYMATGPDWSTRAPASQGRMQ